MVRWIFILSALSLAAATGEAREIFVNNVIGDDIRDGSSPEVQGRTGGPCRTIGRGLQLMRSGDVLILARTDQPYRESVTLQAAPHSGYPQQPCVIMGNGAVLDGTQPVPKDAWSHVARDVYRYRPPRTSFQMLYHGNRPANRRPAPRGSGLPELQPLEWCLYNGHMYFCCEAGKLPREYELSYAHFTVGITLYDVRFVQIRDLTVQGFQLDGINAHDNTFDTRLQGITARGNGRSGISIGGASRVGVIECLVGDNGTAQLRTEGYCKVELIRSDLVENTAPALVREGGQVVVRDEMPR